MEAGETGAGAIVYARRTHGQFAPGIQKVYDLPERVLPDSVDTREPDMDEYAGYLIDTNLRAHGCASLVSLTYLRKGKQLRAAVRSQLEARIETEALTSVTLANGTQLYIDPELLESRAPRSSALVRILSPFDNAVIQRQRGRELFDFDYQIECYLPASKRRFGYFCLPLMYRDRLVGRIDCKAHRAAGRLEIKSMHIEHRLDAAFATAFNRAIQSFAAFNDCAEIQFTADRSNPYLPEIQSQGN